MKQISVDLAQRELWAIGVDMKQRNFGLLTIGLISGMVFIFGCGGGGGSGGGGSSTSTGDICGTVTYNGGGAVSSSNRMLVVFWLESNTNMSGPAEGSEFLTSNPSSYCITLEANAYHGIVMFDSNGDGVYDGDNTTSYEIYDNIFVFDGSSLNIILAIGQTVTVNFDFDDSFTK